jgi:hexosaminidase
MKCLFALLILSNAALFVWGQENKAINIIPQPVSLQVNQGSFDIDNKTKLFLAPSLEKSTTAFIVDMLQHTTGYDLPLTANAAGNLIVSFQLNTTFDKQLGSEGYTLKINPEGIYVVANEANGLFYGMQTLLQLIPIKTSSDPATTKRKIKIPAVAITDFPRFKWRGYMLDVSRHYFPKPFILSLIDQMAGYKYNVFHWHLTDDQGWRIEIKSLPNLTKTGAWRVQRTGGNFEHLEKPQPGELATDGGFYSQDDIREIVSYAKNRFITILPEIDVPAHSSALIASYPNISCRQLPMFVNPGSPLTIAEDNVLCVANDSTYIVLDKVLAEVSQLFPGEYIHIGGDEADKIFWDCCSKCQKLMRNNQLPNTESLQSFFIKKVSTILSAKGKKMIGWEEIMQGGLAQDAVVMSWTSIDAGVKAAQMGHGVIMTPWDQGLYMDKSTIETSYSYDPVPAATDPQFIWGGEACLWTEKVPNEREVQRMFWPRAMALSEVFWSAPGRKDWDSFRDRMEAHFFHLDVMQVKYSKSVYEPIIAAFKDSSNVLRLKIDTEIKGLNVYYSFDNTDPDEFCPKYDGQLLSIPKGAEIIKAISYKNGNPIGKQINKQLNDFRKGKDRGNEDE